MIRKYHNHKLQTTHGTANHLKVLLKGFFLPFGASVNIEDMLSRLEGVFGNVATRERILQEFYTASQKAGESVTA